MKGVKGNTHPCDDERASSSLGMPGKFTHNFSGQSAAEHVRIKQTHLANEYDRVVVTTATGLVFNLEVRDGNGALYGLLESDSVDGHDLRLVLPEDKRNRS